MRSCGIAPNIVSYASLARLYSRQGLWKEVEHLAKAMKSEGLQMNDYFLSALLHAYASAQVWQKERAEVALHDAVQAGVNVNKFVVTAAVRAMGRTRCDQILSELAVAPNASKRKPPSGGLRKPM